MGTEEIQMRQRNPRYRTVEDLKPVAREHYEVARSFRDEWFTRADFLARYERRFPDRAPGSMIISDFRFNEPSKSANDLRLAQFVMWRRPAQYRFVGLDGRGDR
jgi:hypothetical protein